MEFTVKEGHFCHALSKVIKTMKREEKVILIVKHNMDLRERANLPLARRVKGPLNATLQITLELVSWQTMIEVTDDKKVIKKILKEDEGYEHANEGDVLM